MNQSELDDLRRGISGLADAIYCYVRREGDGLKYSGRCANLVDVAAGFLFWLPDADYPGLSDILGHYFNSAQAVLCFEVSLNNWAVLCYGRVEPATGRLGCLVGSLRAIANGPPPKPEEPEEPDEGEDPEDEKEAGYGV